MQDFGFADLRVVNAFGSPFEAAQLEAAQLEARSAVGAAGVMQAARRFDRLQDAVADCTLAVGTTAIGERGLARPVIPLRVACEQILGELTRVGAPPRDAELPSGAFRGEAPGDSDGPVPAKVALLFGSEKTGLTNEQLSYCSLLLTIPMFAPEGRHLSMNLGQAVAVCLYELVREGFEGARELLPAPGERATGADRDRLTGLLTETMQASGYARRFPANAREEIVRQLAGDLGRSRAHAATWMGLFRLALRAMQTRGETEAADPE